MSVPNAVFVKVCACDPAHTHHYLSSRSDSPGLIYCSGSSYIGDMPDTLQLSEHVDIWGEVLTDGRHLCQELIEGVV